ncbi:MAG: hypothetical protein JWP25_5707, partial [Bradyrhizobium sp.]|nr:hypothetical protein [Bradyrhizobium sp.]
MAGSPVAPPLPLSTAPAHISYLQKSSETLKSADGRPIEIWNLSVPDNAASLGTWAKSFRQNYCLDSEIDALRQGTGYSRSEYLLEIVFPDQTKAPGPGVRAGDFAELLVADYIEFLLGYSVPRFKYAEKWSRNESVKGVDIVGFKLMSPPNFDSTDSLLAFEIKAQLTGNHCTERLQVAIDHSS